MCRAAREAFVLQSLSRPHIKGAWCLSAKPAPLLAAAAAVLADGRGGAVDAPGAALARAVAAACDSDRLHVQIAPPRAVGGTRLLVARGASRVGYAPRSSRRPDGSSLGTIV